MLWEGAIERLCRTGTAAASDSCCGKSEQSTQKHMELQFCCRFG